MPIFTIFSVSFCKYWRTSRSIAPKARDAEKHLAGPGPQSASLRRQATVLPSARGEQVFLVHLADIEAGHGFPQLFAGFEDGFGVFKMGSGFYDRFGARFGIARLENAGA